MKPKHKTGSYKEWLIIPLQYYGLISRKEKRFEIFIPYIIAVGCTSVYCYIGRTQIALGKLSEILPTVVSLFIGFTVMLITILLTSGSESVTQLKKTEYSRKVNNHTISLYQALHIQFCHLLLREVLLLLILLLYLFLSGFCIWIWIHTIFLFLETGMTLTILFALVRSITNLYLSFIRPF